MAKTCTVDGCTRQTHARGMCAVHYPRWKRHGDPLGGTPERTPRGVCSVDGCTKAASMCHAYGARLCGAHWQRFLEHGDPTTGGPLARQWTNAICSVNGCSRKAATRGMCKMHYQRWYKTGSPGPPEPQRIIGDNEARFWSYANKTDSCWLWTGPTTENGRGRKRLLYGTISIGGKNIRAHRFAYELLVGSIPEDKELDHTCRNTLCVNPAHLEPVSHAENVIRGEIAKLNAERAAAQTHCKRGHEFTPENTYIAKTKRGRGWQRICRECARLRNRHYAREKSH